MVSGKLNDLILLDSLEFYNKKAVFDTRFNEYMYSLYLDHWRFVKTLSCKDRGVLDDYKNSYAFLLNSILYSSTDIKILQNTIYWYIDAKSVTGDLYTMMKALLLTVLEKINCLDQIFLKAPSFNKNIIVYRGVRGSIAKQIIRMKKGEQIVLKGFNSTALDFTVALEFAVLRGSEEDRIVLRVILPKNTPCILLPGTGGGQSYGHARFKEMMKTVLANDDQTELVLNRNSILRILGHEKHQLSPQYPVVSDDYKSKNFIHVTHAVLIPSAAQIPEPLPSADQIIKQLEYIQIPITS